MPKFRSVEGELKILEREGDFIFPVELWLLNDSVNRNNWQFINLEEHRALWSGKPILVAYVNGGRTVGSGHNQQTKYTKDGEEYQSFTSAESERIVGALSDNPNDIRLESRGGYTWVVGRGFLWAWYARELTEKIVDDARQGRTMSVSIEALVTESRTENGYEVEERYIPLGVTILGDKVQPAVVDAHIAMLESMQDEFKELKLRAASYMNQPQNAENKPKKSMKGLKNRMNFSKKQLAELQAKFGAEYKVLCASADGDTTHVKLMRMSDCSFHSYDLGAKDSAILPEKFVSRAAYIVMSDDNGENDVCAEAADVISETCSAAESEKDVACAENKKLSDELAAAKARIAEMEAFESNRRKNAAAEHAKTILGKYNLNRQEKVPESVISSVVSCAQNGDYNDRMDKDGNWVGLADVEKDVLAMCASEQMKLDAKNVQASKTEFCWEGLSRERGNRDSGDIRSLIDSL